MVSKISPVRFCRDGVDFDCTNESKPFLGKCDSEDSRTGKKFNDVSQFRFHKDCIDQLDRSPSCLVEMRECDNWKDFTDWFTCPFADYTKQIQTDTIRP